MKDEARKNGLVVVPELPNQPQERVKEAMELVKKFPIKPKQNPQPQANWQSCR